MKTQYIVQYKDLTNPNNLVSMKTYLEESAQDAHYAAWKALPQRLFEIESIYDDKNTKVYSNTEGFLE